MSARRVAVLAQRLPDSAQIWGKGGWGYEHEMLAATWELLDATRVQIAQLTGDKKAKKMKPSRLPRPQTTKKKSSWLDVFHRLAGEKKKRR